MKSRSRFTKLALAAVLGLCAGFSAPPAGAAGFLHAQGPDIVDEQGNKVMLRGVGLGNWLLPEGYMWHFGGNGDRPRRIEKIVGDLIGEESAAKFWKEYRDEYVTEKDIRRIAELGFNSVRPALNARLFLSEGDKPEYLEDGFRILDNLVKWCKANNIYVIIDMHGAPGGQTGQNIDDSANDEPLLFMDRKYQDRLVDLWVKIAERYKDEPAVAAYDLLNEPLPDRTGASEKYKDQLEPLYKRVTEAIRKVDKKHMLTVEGYNWANNWSVFTAPPFDDNLVYQFHYYCWDNPTHLNDIDQYLEHRKRLGNPPVWVGETGERDNAIYWGTTALFEHHNIGWSFWPWKKMDAGNNPYSIHSPAGWNAVVGASQNNASEKPSREAAQKTFDELLQNIRLENCTFNQGVVNALFRRLPARIEAENYAYDGEGKSYSIEAAGEKSKLYRKSEFVPVVAVAPAATQGRRRGGGGQAIELKPGEWTAYEVNSLEAKSYAATARVHAAETTSTLQVAVNGKPSQITAGTGRWTEVKFDPASFNKGSNTIKLAAGSGTVQIDWMAFE